MRNLISFLLLIIGSGWVFCTISLAQNKDFINIETGNLESRLAKARQLQESINTADLNSQCIIAYAFPVRPHVAVDVVIKGLDNQPELGNVLTGNVGEYETRNVGVFLFYNKTNGQCQNENPVRVQVYNLDRRRSFNGAKVYWLGRIDSTESLGYLVHLINQTTDGENLAEAIALHDDPQAESILESLAKSAQSEKVRVGAVSWLGRLGSHIPLLVEVAGNNEEQLEVRMQSVKSIGKSSDPGVIESMKKLYASVNNRALKDEIIDSSAKSRQADAVDFLSEIAKNDADAELSGRARSRLYKITGEKKRSKP